MTVTREMARIPKRYRRLIIVARAIEEVDRNVIPLSARWMDALDKHFDELRTALKELGVCEDKDAGL
jgi:hypothetical protein